MGYVVNFTRKKYDGFKFKAFKTRRAAEYWVETHKDTIHWSQIVSDNPKSEWPKFVIQDMSRALETHVPFVGVLDTYFETGMECTGIVLTADEPKGALNPNFDPSKPEDKNNFKHFSSFDALHFIENGDIIVLQNGIAYGMMKDRDFAKEDGYRLSFYPRGFSKKEIVDMFAPGTTKATLWKMKKT